MSIVRIDRISFLKLKRPIKPTVSLSHSSTNRRELLILKRLLDDRAGGLIEFFLSSDDESIAHGTIWPAEVRAALDRMSLMLIFVSSEALTSGWTTLKPVTGSTSSVPQTFIAYQVSTKLLCHVHSISYRIETCIPHVK